MSRKTIIWIVAGVLAAAVLAAVAVVAYHVGFDHGAGGGAILRRPLRDNGFSVAFGRRGVAAFPGVGAFLILLIGGIAGGAIVYLWRGSARTAGAIAAGYEAPAAAGRAADPQWRQFEEWHRTVHSPAGAGDQATGTTTPGAPSVASTSTPPQPPVMPPQPPQPPTTPAQPPQPPTESE